MDLVGLMEDAALCGVSTVFLVGAGILLIRFAETFAAWQRFLDWMLGGGR